MAHFLFQPEPKYTDTRWAYREHAIVVSPGWGMPRSDYCRRQAELLFAMAFAVSDPELAERLRGRAEQYLAEADVADDPSEVFDRAVDEFNNDQMRGS